jgi:hypothetical protein
MKAAARSCLKTLICGATLNTKHGELFAFDLKIAGWLYLGYEPSVNTWKIKLHDVADLSTEFVGFFHGLGDDCHFTVEMELIAYFRSDKVFFAELVTATSVLVCTGN